VRVEVSTEAEEFVRGQGGQLWVWAAHPRVCCWGTPAYMYAATTPPRNPDGFSPAHTAGLQVWYRIRATGGPTCWRSGCGASGVRT
jgi:hypothetical protein